jgi:hypothetical protein
LFKSLEPDTKAFRIERADRKRPNAALRAARAARQPWTAAPGCIRERCIYDLYEPLITLRKHSLRIVKIGGEELIYLIFVWLQ